MLLHHRFVCTSKKFSGKTAIIDRSTNKKFTYSQALTASLMFAECFGRLEKGLTGVMLPTSAGCAFSTIGLLMSGRTPVMINYSTGAERNAEYAKKKCGLSAIITSRSLLERIKCPVVDGMVFIEDILDKVSYFEKIKAALKAMLPQNILLNSIQGGDMDENLVILFTSGSEKDPKAVQLTHRNIDSNINGITEAFRLTGQDSTLANLPLFHVFGLTVCMWLPFYHGMTSITYANPLDFKEVCNVIRTEKPTIVAGAPSFLWGYLKKSEPGDFDSVRIAVSGADKCPAPLREGFLEKHNMTLLEGYGVTETSPVISSNTPWDNRPGSIGRPISGVSVKIENPETGRECQTGETGKIMVKGDLVMKGYLDDIEETSLCLRDGWYDTGDMGFIDGDGYLWHAGRLKRFVKIGGEMVSLLKVEETLERLLPQDASCCVVDVPDESKGAKIVAVVTQRVDEKDILRKMSGELPNIFLPKQFIVFDDLPKMGSGKIDFRKITEMARAAQTKPH